MFWILLIGVAVGVMFKPRLFTWLGLFFFELMFFSNESTSGAIIAAIVLGAVACLRMEFTKDCSAIMYEVKGCDCKNPPTDGLIIHAAIIGVLYAATSYIVWVWSLAAQPGTRFLRLLIIYPAIAFGVPLLSGFLASFIMHGRIVNRYNKEVEAERQRLEAERQRIAAEKAAAQKRLDLACENMKALWEKVLSTYGRYDDGQIGARGFGANGSHFKSLPDTIYYKRVAVELPMVPMYYATGYRQSGPAATQIRVTNEQRLQAIDGILEDVNLLNGYVPFEYDIATVKIPGSDDASRPWLWYIEHTLNFFYPQMNAEYYNWLDPIRQYYDGERKAIQAGLDGEEYIRRALELHDGEFFVLYDLRLEFPGANGGNDSVETDVLVLAPNGIFAIEVKNYGSTGKYKIIVTADGQWYKELPGGKREPIPNPVAQNDRHIAFLGRFINELLGRDMMNRAAIGNIIAIANDAVETDIYPGAPLTVTRAGNIYGCIMADRSPKFTLDELQLLKRELEKRAMPPNAFPLDDYRGHVKWLVHQHEILCYGSHMLIKAANEHPDWFSAI